MALYLPISIPDSLHGACIGNFLSTSCFHLAVPSAIGLTFKSVLEKRDKSKDQDFGLNGIDPGSISSVLSVPYYSELRNKPSNELDIVAIHSRIHNASAASYDQINFKKFNTSTLEFDDLGSYKCIAPKNITGSMESANATVVQVSKTGYGIFTFSNGYEDLISFINPMDGSLISQFRNSFQSSKPVSLYWVAPDNLVVAQVRNFIHSISFIKAKMKLSTSGRVRSLKLKLIASTDIHSTVRCIGAAGNNHEFAVLCDGGKVFFWKLFPKDVIFLGEKSIPFPPESSKIDYWYLGNTADNEPVYLISGMKAIKIGKENSMTSLSVDASHHGSLRLLKGSNQFIVTSDVASGNMSYVCQFRYENYTGQVSQYIRGSAPMDIQGLKPISHEFDASVGSTFWSSVNSPVIYNDTLIRTRNVLKLHFQHFSRLGYVGWITRIWVVSQNPILLMASTIKGSFMIDLTSFNEQKVYSPSWMNPSETTLAAAAGVQVTKTSIYSPSNTPYTLRISGVTIAATDGVLTVVASPVKAQFISRKEILKEVDFDTLVVDVDCFDEMIAVLTVDALYIYHTYGNSHEIKLTHIGSCVKVLETRDIIVGFVDGSVSFFSTQNRTYDQIHTNVSKFSIRCMCFIPTLNSVATSAGSDELSFVSVTNGLKRTSIRGCESAAYIPWMNALLLVTKGQLGLVSLINDGEIINEIDTVGELHREPRIVISSNIYTLDSQERKLYLTHLSSSPYTTSHSLPNHPCEDRILANKLFLIGKDLLLEVAVSAKEDPTETDDQEILINLRIHLYLYSLRYSHRKAITSVELEQELVTSLRSDSEEDLGIKFVTPSVFVVYTSMECVSFKMNPSQTLIQQLGPSEDVTRLLHQERWLYDSDTGIVWVIQATGEVGCTQSNSLYLSEPSCYPIPNNFTNIFENNRNGRSVVLNSVLIGRTCPSIPTTRFVFVNSSFTSMSTELLLCEINEDTQSVTDIARLVTSYQDICLTQVNKDYIKSLQNSALQKKYDYLHLLIPEIVFSLGNTGIYYLCLIKDQTFLSRLQTLQQKLLDQLYITEGSLFANTSELINGYIILYALRKPGLYNIFRNAGIDPEQLKKAFETILE